MPHHGLDLVDPGARYSAGHFARDAEGVAGRHPGRGRMPIVVGGTGLYVRALADGLFREPPLDAARRRSLDAFTARLEPLELLRWAGRLDPGFRGGGRQRAARAIEVALLTGRPLSYWQEAARARGPLDPWYIVLTVPRPVLHQRIARRAEEMVRRGLIEEVAAVLAEGHPPTAPGLDGIGIREAVDYLHGRRPRESVAEAIAVNTRQYAKRQQTWFRHQLGRRVLTLDATRPPERLAAEIAGGLAEGRRMKIGITCYPTYGGSGAVATELGLELAASRARGALHHLRLALPAPRLHRADLLPPGRDADGAVPAVRPLSLYARPRVQAARGGPARGHRDAARPLRHPARDDRVSGAADAERGAPAPGDHHPARHRHHAGRAGVELLRHHQVLDRAERRGHGGLRLPARRDLPGLRLRELRPAGHSQLREPQRVPARFARSRELRGARRHQGDHPRLATSAR